MQNINSALSFLEKRVQDLHSAKNKLVLLNGSKYLSTSTKIVFRKYNFAEHLTIASFIIGYATLASIISLVTFKWQILLYNPVVYIVIFWMIYQVFINKKYKSETFFLSILCLLLFLIQLFLILVGIGIGLVQS